MSAGNQTAKEGAEGIGEAGAKCRYNGRCSGRERAMNYTERGDA